MNATGPKKGAKIILKLLILTWRPALRKNQGGPSNREKLRECFILDSGCTGWQNTPQNLLNINLPNLVGWLQETLRKEQKLFRSDTFQLDGKFLKKKQSTIKRRKTAKMPYIWFWVHWLAEHAPNSDQYQFTKLGLLAATDPKEGTKITWKLIFLIGRGVLIKIQRALFNTKNGRKWLIFDSGCTGWQSMLRNPLIIDLPNLFGWLEVTLRK